MATDLETLTPKLEVYLNHLAKTNRVAESCQVADIPYDRLKDLRTQYPVLNDKEDHARQCFREVLQKEIHRRAVEGIERLKFHNDREYTELQYSDSLMALHIKAHCPEYREKFAADVNLKGGVLAVPITPPTEEEWAALPATDTTPLEEDDAPLPSPPAPAD